MTVSFLLGYFYPLYLFSLVYQRLPVFPPVSLSLPPSLLPDLGLQVRPDGGPLVFVRPAINRQLLLHVDAPYLERVGKKREEVRKCVSRLIFSRVDIILTSISP